ncbi:hypothetical protein PTSG_00017 [Salpingoeca rosetta]|uniref:Uncharacterized protein n=1 Tax=Salpingoeca rosetta (strain ATCC 50818 / BSB-021) TaxID=946362 RepID=F2TVA5_SALR5|nr:uncharacterized protein PTSG_00017 [Salpingoeca rosetta]EGD72001.1 hypothetical protein PTSG_00017 [Salpingoeca rosetta]|eukprot:XP_004998573.1 hypothetical protein PTSG_00017 [Salpingoeca rosetta]
MEGPTSVRRRLSRSHIHRRLMAIRRVNLSRQVGLQGLEDEHRLLASEDRNRGLSIISVGIDKCDGGCFDAEHVPQNVLRFDGSVYCSEKRRNVNLMLSPTRDEHATVFTHVMVAAPEVGYTSPIQDGLVFLPTPNTLTSASDAYRDMTKEQFDELWARKQRNNEPWDPSEPVCFFSLTSEESQPVVVPFKVAVPASRVLVHLLRPQSECGENIDIAYLGFKGYRGSTTFSTFTLL